MSLGELAGFCVPALVGGLLREGAPWLVPEAVVLAGVVEGAILGRMLPSSLRRHGARAARWIPIAAAGWGAGLHVSTAVATPLWQPGRAAATVVATGALGGALPAVTMDAATGPRTSNVRV